MIINQSKILPSLKSYQIPFVFLIILNKNYPCWEWILKPSEMYQMLNKGQNIISAIIDEINFMEVTEKSRKSIDGGTYNQALALYNSISRRRKSRFMSKGRLPGMVCIVSSKRYPGQFTDGKEAEAEQQVQETGTSNIYVCDKTIWQVKPWEFSGNSFKLFVGDESRKPRILKNEIINAKDKHLIKKIPKPGKLIMQSIQTTILQTLWQVSCMV